jgi:hypothetical protein
MMTSREQRWKDLQDLLDGQAELFEQLRGMVSAFFGTLVDDQPRTRRPIACLRIPSDGTAPGRLIVRPAWSKWSKTVNTAALEVELVVEDMKVNGQVMPVREIVLSIRPGAVSCRRAFMDRVQKAVERVTATARDFINDPMGTLAKASDHCCICGHALTDEGSRSRGIGPECLRGAECFRRYLEKMSVAAT